MNTIVHFCLLGLLVVTVPLPPSAYDDAPVRVLIINRRATRINSLR